MTVRRVSTGCGFRLGGDCLLVPAKPFRCAALLDCLQLWDRRAANEDQA